MDVTNFTEPRHLTASEDISGFDCGLPLANDWLVSTHIGQYLPTFPL